MRSNLITKTLCTAAVIATTSLAAWAQNDQGMLDQITLSDGRQFTCEILEETSEFIKVEIIHLGMKTVQTWPKSMVLEVKHDSVKAQTPEQAAAKADTAAEKPEMKGRPVYVVQLTGVVGLDSHKRIIQRQWDEALDLGAKTIVMEWDCEQAFPPATADMEEYREFFQDLKTQARNKEVDVVAWVKKASGIAVAYSMIFEDIYFHPTGEMGGGWIINEALSDMFNDEAVRAKMISAWVGICRGMAEEGGHSAELCEAMIRPEVVLSMNMAGGQPTFRLDTRGDFILDSNGGSDPAENTFELNAGDAEKYGVSKGTARTLEDLMYELKFREFHHIEGNAELLVEGWNEGWKAAMDEVREIRADIEEIATRNETPERIIGQQIRKLREIQGLIKRWPPLGVFIDSEQLYFEIDTLQKQLRNINNRDNGTGGGRGGGRRGPDN